MENDHALRSLNLEKSQRILFIAHFLPYPPMGGDKTRVASLINWLVDSEHEVSFIFVSIDFPG